ncbi:hypothetical protein MKEN_00809600 [Mycena kentingensis (nom. inval.)]|nr:hypothetical protein MKEN_00809600 [Mycena kentingensis (nom. inval.)]
MVAAATPTLLSTRDLQPRITPSPAGPVEQVVVELTTTVLIPDYARFYSSPLEQFEPSYINLPDGSLASDAFIEDLRRSYTSLLVVALLASVFLRNLVVCVDYFHRLPRANMKRRLLFFMLLASQVLSLGLAPFIASYFNSSLDCTAVVGVADGTTGFALALLMSGILGLKAYRCLDSSRCILLVLIALFAASTSFLVLHLSSISGMRRLSGGCSSRSNNPQFIRIYVLIQLLHSFFLCCCFFYAVWKSRASPAVRGRLSVRVSLDDFSELKFDKPTSQNWWNQLLGRGNNTSVLDIPTLAPSDAPPPTVGSKESGASRARRNPFWRHNVSDPIMEEPLVENETPRPRSRPSSILRLIPRMELFHTAMKDELLYTTTIMVTTVVLAVLVVLGVNIENRLDLPSWLSVNEAIISVLIIHSFGRVVQRHEREALLHHSLQHSPAWWPDRSRRVIPASPLRVGSEDPFSDSSAIRDSLSSWKSELTASPTSPLPAASRDRRSSLPSPFADMVNNRSNNAREQLDEKGVYVTRVAMDDEVVSRIPIRFSNALAPKIHIHQFPLLTRPLQVPPSSAAAGKRITARIKAGVGRLEVHVPADTRSEVWNGDRGRELGAARVADDREKNQEIKGKGRETDEPRLTEVRMRSEQIQQPSVYMLGIMRDGQLHLHPISETHQMRPTLTYLDILSRKNKRSHADSDDSDDDGPPPDPDEAPPPPVEKKVKKPSGETKEVHVAARKTDDKNGGQTLGGLSTARREMLAAIHAEEDEGWQDLKFYDVTTGESEEAFTGLFSRSEERDCSDEGKRILSMSDTESEQEYGPTTQFVPPRPSLAPETILDAIEQLSQLTLPALDILVKVPPNGRQRSSYLNNHLQDTRIHEIITRASSDILSFLDSFQALVVQPNEGAQQRLLDFAALGMSIPVLRLRIHKIIVDVQFFATLFGQRKVFHRIASQGTKHAVVCWVDAILAKIGDASVSIATGVPFDELNPALSFGKTIQEQEEDALAAAAQLPADWEDVFCIIASEEPSPAARRLALRLSFAAFILAPALSRKPNQHPHELLEVLEKYVTHTRGSRYTTSAVGTRLAVQERLGFGMIACLFATSDRQSQSTRGRPTTRPHTLGSLLGLIQEVIHPQDTVASLSLVKPPEPTNLDEPIRMLLTWGNVTSWCWHVWDDHRVANSESIVYLTSLFLQSSEPPELNFANRASSIAILRVLHHIVLTLTSHLTGAVCPAVMKNACLYAGQFTIASPLTLNVCRELERASADGRDDYARILKCRVDGIGACLLDAVRGQEVASAPSVAAFRIAFYRSPGAHMAILVD